MRGLLHRTGLGFPSVRLTTIRLNFEYRRRRGLRRASRSPESHPRGITGDRSILSESYPNDLGRSSRTPPVLRYFLRLWEVGARHLPNWFRYQRAVWVVRLHPGFARIGKIDRDRLAATDLTPMVREKQNPRCWRGSTSTQQIPTLLQ